jgi:HEPN domain-containing protein
VVARYPTPSTLPIAFYTKDLAKRLVKDAEMVLKWVEKQLKY